MNNILKKYNIKAKKSLGQNYLTDDFILDNIVNSIEIKEKNIIEIGPGFGALTKKILERNPKSLELIELDKNMISILEDRIGKNDLKINNIKFKIHNTDILKYNIKNNEEYNLVGNIPYYITSPIIFKFLYEEKNKPENMLILMQKDVADKILVGNDKSKNKSSFLSTYIYKKATVKKMFDIKAESFTPAPKVDSTLLLFKSHNNYEKINDERFLELLKLGFKNPRKKLINNLGEKYNKSDFINRLNNLGFNENVRGESLKVDDWISLYDIT